MRLRGKMEADGRQTFPDPADQPRLPFLDGIGMERAQED